MKKPGWRTTEFWLSTVATLCGLLYSAEIIGPEETGSGARALGFIAAALSTLGYSVSRAIVKK